VIAPAAPIKGLSSGIGSWISGIAAGPKLSEENAKLRSQIKNLKMVPSINNVVQSDAERSEDLRKILAKLGAQTTPARVVALHLYENRITLDIPGDPAGVLPGQAVVAPGGLLGVIQTVSGHRCQANLIFSPQVVIGAMTNTVPGRAGLLRGESPDRMTLDFSTVPGELKLQIKLGASVVTSGFSDRIPRGIPIGTVVDVEEVAEFAIRRAKVVPNVLLADAKDVVIVR
jgi:rod shape-determining protein MreC